MDSTKTHSRNEPPRARKSINLAFQGGGSHGAFTWGVLDRILEDERIAIEAVCGASAGAMNAVVLAAGLVHEDREEARQGLRDFWDGVSDSAVASPFRRWPLDVALGRWTLDHNPAYLGFDLMSRLASPYDFNPMNINPLRELVAELVDFDRVRCCTCLKVFISATNVETGRVRVFQRHELTVDHVMASACLPFLYQAVEIDGVPYWDGGYMGNPPLWPLFDHSSTDDVVVVEINPIVRPGVPRTAREILNRVNEITFNASLMRELRAIDFVTRLMDDHRLEGTGYRRVLVHRVADTPTLSSLGASSKLNAEHAFIDMLFETGRAAADRWIHDHYDDIGKRSTVDLRTLFQGDEDPLDGSRIHRQEAYKDSGAACKKPITPT